MQRELTGSQNVEEQLRSSVIFALIAGVAMSKAKARVDEPHHYVRVSTLASSGTWPRAAHKASPIARGQYLPGVQDEGKNCLRNKNRGGSYCARTLKSPGVVSSATSSQTLPVKGKQAEVG